VLLSAQWGGPNGIAFSAVTLFGGTLNLAQFNSIFDDDLV